MVTRLPQTSRIVPDLPGSQKEESAYVRGLLGLSGLVRRSVAHRGFEPLCREALRPQRLDRQLAPRRAIVPIARAFHTGHYSPFFRAGSAAVRTLIQPAASSPRTLSVRTEALLSAFATPLILGALQAAVCLLLTFVELAEPPARPGFAGMAFSNAINSPGAWNGLLLFQDAFDWLPGVEVGAALSPTAYLGWRRGGVLLLALLQLLAL